MSQPSHMSQLPQGLLQSAAAAMFNPSFPVPPYQTMPNFQVGLSDHNIMKIAMQTKQLLSQEIDKLVEEKMKVKTAELCKSVESLQSDNLKLKDSISKLEVKLTTKMGDLEQYSRRSCVRIAGIHENTNEHVLDLAVRLNIDISPRDIDRSHRVGPLPTEATSIANDAQPARPREIIVKLKSIRRVFFFYKLEKHYVTIKEKCISTKT